MHNIWTIARRELKLYFISPIAYIVMLVTLLILGLIFYVSIMDSYMNQYTPPTIQVVIGPLVTIFLFSVPALTMRTIADETRSGTMEIIMTSPVRDWELIIGKWLGATLFYLSILAITWIFAIMLNVIVTPGIDQGLLVSNYLGLLLLTGLFISIGVFASSLSSNQIAAFFTGMGILLLFWLIGLPAQVMGAYGSRLLSYLDIGSHFYNSFYLGVIDLKDLTYYISGIVLFLFLAKAAIEIRRWR
jgi:ABC-2 type transport system permease protein